MNKTANRGRTFELIDSIRSLFHQLREVGTAVHEDLGVNASMRGVMESLSKNGPGTVSRMARARPVSRQHIQRIVDELKERGLVRLEPNPDHKTSPMVTLTEEGARTFTLMRQRELTLIDAIGARLDLRKVETALSTLAELRSTLPSARPRPGGADTRRRSSRRR